MNEAIPTLGVGQEVVNINSKIQLRFWDNLNKEDSEICWNWMGYRNRVGYGQIKVGGKNLRAHRVAYAIANGHVPASLDVLHSCDNPPCCNPNHLWLGTDLDNVADKVAKGRQAKGAIMAPYGGVFQRAQTHCKRGHPFDEKNTRHRNGTRRCRTCVREWSKAHYKKIER